MGKQKFKSCHTNYLLVQMYELHTINTKVFIKFETNWQKNKVFCHFVDKQDGIITFYIYSGIKINSLTCW